NGSLHLGAGSDELIARLRPALAGLAPELILRAVRRIEEQHAIAEAANRRHVLFVRCRRNIVQTQLELALRTLQTASGRLAVLQFRAFRQNGRPGDAAGKLLALLVAADELLAGWQPDVMGVAGEQVGLNVPARRDVVVVVVAQ